MPDLFQHYPDLEKIYDTYGAGILEKARLAKNFEVYCKKHTVRWGYGKKRLEKEFPELKPINAKEMISSSSNGDYVLYLDLNGFIRFSFTLQLTENDQKSFSVEKLSARYGITYLQEYGTWQAGTVNLQSVHSLLETHAILHLIAEEKRKKNSLKFEQGPLPDDDYSKFF